MPREIVNDRYLVPNQLTGEGPKPDEMPSVSVGWDRRGMVQIGTAKDDGEAGISGLFVELDRDGINRLIRLLRKARDVAFGSDA